MDEYLNNNIATNGSYFLLRMQQQSDEHNWLLLISNDYATDIGDAFWWGRRGVRFFHLACDWENEA
jgi:hypothetical protein